MLFKLQISFAYDYDSDHYLISKAKDARSWQVIVHCKDAEQHTTKAGLFTPYPGCDTHEGATAWYIDYYGAEKIEIQREGHKPVFINHPDKDI